MSDNNPPNKSPSLTSLSLINPNMMDDSDSEEDLGRPQSILTREDEAFDLKDYPQITIIGPNEEFYYRKQRKYKLIKNRYVKGLKINHGMTSVVKEALDEQTLERLAVKIMTKAKIKYYRLEEKVKLEVKVLKQLKHPSIIRLVDFHEDIKKGKLYLIMELCIAGLDEFLKAAPNHELPIPQAQRYFRGLIEGVEYIHSKGVIHRDIKTENLLVDYNDNIKIADFGSCYQKKLFESDEGKFGFEGSEAYMPPELSECDENLKYHSEHYIGTKFDVWSCGVTLLYMVTNHFLFDDRQYTQKLTQHKGVYPLPTLVRKDEYLNDILSKMLIRSPAGRISIEDIKKHSFINIKYPLNSFHVSIPEREHGDIYRSSNILPILATHYYPEPPDEEKVIESEYEKSLQPKTPTIRSSRLKLTRTNVREERKRHVLGIIGMRHHPDQMHNFQ